MRPLQVPEEEYLRRGHVGCAGCGAVIAMRFALKALGPDTVVVIPACCWGVIAGAYPQSSLDVPILHAAFATAGATASGVRAALDMRGEPDTTVMAWAGDGGTFDIGLQSLSGAVERDEDILYVCYDNEAYMNTGVQRSSSTPYGTRTTTTPREGWKRTRKKNIMETLAAHRIAYAATASIAYPEDMIRKFRKARDLKGHARFLHVFASCPTGWGVPSELTVKLARLAVRTNVFPLYEVENGVSYTLNTEGDLPVRAYLSPQGRFRHLSPEDIQDIQRMVDEDWRLLRAKAQGPPQRARLMA
ncbi:MAG: pyruvate synthase subunit beta [Deltaproteobacteria bacterium]|nr:pyruvate synthase subunit beta [Deltaproteobacteria bacterium]MBW1923988.1 pyruvate synthase subunit beta [Deltaproteobacteria bacterium]MBW1948953.1 pyruvate synthase subunit beta [Deltaproteobacteria bacterium]MBW2007128.1 pyruvate synthase subunit beta [Deltaproteobacteria bacterium]MBW2103431.1 pyruvate synthase subunit beta [Deltaproteobacteria bacterium]